MARETSRSRVEMPKKVNYAFGESAHPRYIAPEIPGWIYMGNSSEESKDKAIEAYTDEVLHPGAILRVEVFEPDGQGANTTHWAIYRQRKARGTVPPAESATFKEGQ